MTCCLFNCFLHTWLPTHHSPFQCDFRDSFFCIITVWYSVLVLHLQALSQWGKSGACAVCQGQVRAGVIWLIWMYNNCSVCVCLFYSLYLNVPSCGSLCAVKTSFNNKHIINSFVARSFCVRVSREEGRWHLVVPDGKKPDTNHLHYTLLFAGNETLPWPLWFSQDKGEHFSF